MINFDLFNPQQPKNTIQPLPSAPSSGGGLSDLLGGIKGLADSLINKHPTNNSGTALQAGLGVSPQAPNSPVQTTSQGTPNPSIGQQLFGASSPSNSGLQGQPSKYGLSSDLNQLYQRPAFQTALKAQQESFKSGVTNSPIMTVVDFSVPSDQPRMWVVDTKQNKVLMHTYVAQGSGGFNTTPGSHGSETGTFLTGDVYHSNHMNKDALKIQGLDKGVNDNAFARGIVVHGGNYIGKDKQGTSWGCFAIPDDVAPKLIGITKGGTIIHAYAPEKEALNSFSNTLSSEGKQALHTQLAMNNRSPLLPQPSAPNNAYNPNVPIHNLNSQEINTLMKNQGPSLASSLGPNSPHIPGGQEVPTPEHPLNPPVFQNYEDIIHQIDNGHDDYA